VGDVCFGSVMGPSSQRANECRIAMFLAGFPTSVPVHTVNRQCSSGLQAIAEVAASIRAGFYTIGIAGGVESMTTNPMAWEGAINPRVAESQCAQDCLLPMGITSENVAAQYGVSRETQDKFAARSHALAAAAQAAGKFRDEIVPVPTVLKDPKTGEERRVVIDADDGIRLGTTPASLSQLKPVFKKGGSTTAGNSSQVTDGAAAVMLMTRQEAAKRGLPILGIFRSFAAVGVPPAVMGIGPAVAIPAAVSSVLGHSAPQVEARMCALLSARPSLPLRQQDDRSYCFCCVEMAGLMLVPASLLFMLLTRSLRFAYSPILLPQVEMAGLTLDDIDVFEINEAFASQASATAPQLCFARTASSAASGGCPQAAPHPPLHWLPHILQVAGPLFWHQSLSHPPLPPLLFAGHLQRGQAGHRH
jgi:acetyl-CoA acetyltransferase